MAPLTASPDLGARLGAASAQALQSGASTQKTRDAAQEFEQVFLSNVLSLLTQGLEGDGPLGNAGAGGDVWRSFLTDRYAHEIAAKGGVGIADQVMREMIRMQETRR